MAPRPQTAASIHWEQVSYGEWIIVFRALRLEAPVKCVGYALATHADWKTGHDAFPGIQTLALETGYRSHHTIVDALKVLREMKLIERRTSGSRSGRRGNADSYHLTLTNLLREAAGVDPCQCKPRAALGDHMHEVQLFCHRPASGRTTAERVQISGRTHVSDARGSWQNTCTWCRPTKYPIHQRLINLSINAHALATLACVAAFGSDVSPGQHRSAA